MNKKTKQIQIPNDFVLVAADLSLKRPGFALIDVTIEQKKAKINNVNLFSVDNKTKTKTHGRILIEIMQTMRTKFDQITKPMLFVREKRIQTSHFTDNFVYQTVGVSNIVSQYYGKEWQEIYPTTVKKLIAQKGTATKDQVAEALKKYVGELNYANDDQSDATAVGVGWLISKQFQIVHTCS